MFIIYIIILTVTIQPIILLASVLRQSKEVYINYYLIYNPLKPPQHYIIIFYK